MNFKFGLVKYKDFRYMFNVILLVIVNILLFDLLVDVFNKWNKVYYFDKEIDEDMIFIFGYGVDSKFCNNKYLFLYCNWCVIWLYVFGYILEFMLI